MTASKSTQSIQFTLHLHFDVHTATTFVRFLRLLSHTLLYPIAFYDGPSLTDMAGAILQKGHGQLD